MPYTQVANLDFEDIKVALKEYIRAQSDFTDYDFDGSVLSTLIDTLAYNTYYTAFNANLVVNELFIDSATLRDNVVAIAKQLGYRPKGITSPTAYVSFNVSYGTSTTDTELLLKKGTGFISSFDNNIYQYITLEDVTGQVVNNVATFDNVEVREGTQILNTFTVNTALKSQRFVLDNQNIDTNTIRVKVYPSGSNFNESYLVADNILNVDSTSKVFFIEEIEDDRYEILLGDGVLGKKVDNGSRVEVSYITTSGPESNGVKTFVFSGVIENPNGVSPNAFSTAITNVEASTGGEDKESVKNIKTNAPKMYGTQDRAVTAQDYSAIIRKVYPSVSDIIIFGGEDQDPPEYGKVFIVLKPKDASFLTSLTKQEIINDLKKYMVASVRPVIVDPSILYVELTSKVYYNGESTDLKPAQIRDKTINSVQSYLDVSDIEKFNGKFRFSKLVSVIDDADPSINSNLTEVTMRKDFYPSLNSTFYYEVCFQNAFDKDCDEPTLSSTGFRVTEYPTFDVYLEDRDSKIVLYRIDSVTGEKVVLDSNVGDIDYEKGELKMYALTIIRGSFFDNRISVRVKPLLNDIKALREVYLDVDVANSSFTAYKE
ncbi:baseplate wedge subunit [Synechococcus phage ACG-2014j]|mgnify:FL=1|uniref:Baseplate wedge subunit n=2 Tax=Potamoivirus TaxID=2948872 RepID=A0A1D8KMI6_9CAUD|nr:baseplate wedge subunit [Synechococcus phage ACG-2014j]YP_009320521.1 baseplate wedge subunit [Synechococcus phage S-CAM4]AIX23976.1 baseplate wedge protein [Synechococcus phage ACG-2014j]AOV59311.1 baseplate wedge subunit [Synechococcus phage S-CAM4]AOV59549.1 baseplate wedge subunit [Synechococcus phage S-CAM4]AOV59787.1 baseplate wedge subunit [Synechococcus phage S-CAM4]